MGPGRIELEQGGEHMFSPLRNRFGIPGVISVIALVFAMAGGAYAAKKYVITSTSQIKPSVLKSLTGKAGPQGPAGANGKDGANGSSGTNGKDGNSGSPGAVGKSVVVGSFTTEDEELEEPPGEPCSLNGGSEVEVEGSGEVKYVCNGSPWAAGGTLPTGATETGAWNLKTASFVGETSVSFPVPMENALPGAKVPLNSLATGTGELTEGSTLITGLTHTANTPPWARGTRITGTGIEAGTIITEVEGPTEIVISQAVEAGKSASGVALSSPVWPECDDGVGPAATAEHPEADSGFVCLFAARATGVIQAISAFKSGSSETSPTGASRSGARLAGGSTTATDTVAGTFAVTG
jgi:hypothetical protein